MGAYPTTPRAAFLEWCQAHAPVFATNAEDIGLTEVQASAFTAATTALAAASLAQEQAKQAAKVATQTANDAYATLRGGSGDAVRSIRAFAELQIKPLDVYNLAQIPPPAAPTPMPPPGQPTDLTVTLTPADGALTLRWKCTNPTGSSGTSYIVRRKLPGEGAFAFIGVAGKKEFVDGTLIAGPDTVLYTVQAQRSDQSGPLSAIFTVNFGVAPGGGFVATVAESHGLEARASGAGLPASTVDGRMVQKVTPTGNGRPAARSRG